MPESNYSPQQKEAIQKVWVIVQQLQKIEKLQKQKYDPISSGLEGYAESSCADLVLDNLPPYDTLETRLRESLQKAKELGLGEDEFIIRIDNEAHPSLEVKV